MKAQPRNTQINPLGIKMIIVYRVCLCTHKHSYVFEIQYKFNNLE